MDQERVRHALQRLSPEQRLVISLRFLEERSHEEVALVLGKTVEATRALQHRAIAALRQMLLQQED
jgi:RNA polymerase sigma-70 factor (ECF subfamily)